MDHSTGVSKGFGFVKYEDHQSGKHASVAFFVLCVFSLSCVDVVPSTAAAAMQALHNYTLDNSKLAVKWAETTVKAGPHGSPSSSLYIKVGRLVIWSDLNDDDDDGDSDSDGEDVALMTMIIDF